MIFEELSLKGAYLIKPDLHRDERGFFARSFCKQEFQTLGLVDEYVQCNISYNNKKGTLRGMHYQVSPHQETKLVRCTQGAIYDVIIDIRQDSLTYKKWLALELTADNRAMLYLPEGFAHGFLTLQDNTEIFYQMSVPFKKGFDRTIRWDNLQVGIEWPFTHIVISEKDKHSTHDPF